MRTKTLSANQRVVIGVRSYVGDAMLLMPADTPSVLRPKEVARLLNVGESTVRRMVGLEWVEYHGRGQRPIRRITADSVRRLLEQRKTA